MANENFLNKPMLAFLWAQLKARMVLSEAGKGLSANDFTNLFQAGLVSLMNNDVGYQTRPEVDSAIVLAIESAMNGVLTETEVQQLIDAALAAFDHEIFVVVDELPDVQEASANKIYLVPADGGGFDEWYVKEGAWELLGSTSVDLSGYWNDGNLLPMTQAEILEILDEE